jgi:hypothetical protein
VDAAVGHDIQGANRGSQSLVVRDISGPSQQQFDDRRLREPWRPTPASMLEVEVGHQALRGCGYDTTLRFIQPPTRQSDHLRLT